MTDKKTSSPIIVIFGITGDLSKRKLLPALYHLIKHDLLPENTQIIGTSRKDLTTDELISTVELCVLEKDQVCDPKVIEKIKNTWRTVKLNPNEKSDYKILSALISENDPGEEKIHMFYMSVPATAYGPIISGLAANNLNKDNSRLLLEKPFGYDMKSAEELIHLINQYFKEKQIYRIDHYLAKDTAQNLLAFRLHNPIFKPLWNSEHIQSIHVKALETIGIEGRVNFYEQTGALRDFVQSHLMQLLSLVMMDLPQDMSSEELHRVKQIFFEGLDPADPEKALRAQYDSYKDEVKNDKSYTETYARLILNHRSSTWDGTEIILETGKAMAEKITVVTIEFKTPHERRRNSLTFHIQPNEGISLDLVVKEPGLEDAMRHAELNFSYNETFKDYEYIDAYERVLMDVVRGDQSLFASDREVLSTWKVLQGVLDKWQKNSDGLKIYSAGSKEIELN